MSSVGIRDRRHLPHGHSNIRNAHRRCRVPWLRNRRSVASATVQSCPRDGGHRVSRCAVVGSISDLRVRSRGETAYQESGLRKFVPGTGEGSWLFASAFGRIQRPKSAWAFNCREGRLSPGVIKPIILLVWDFTRRIASMMSLSFVTTTAQSYASSQASFSRWTARFTSEPFSSVLITSTVLCPRIGLASRDRTVWVKNVPKKNSTCGQ